jgi:nicotinate-nucleotide adenylyltransferase
MRTLCFGGSFNPVHHGHLICARAVAEARGFERVLLIPSALPPHKLSKTDLAPAEDRLQMCRRAVEGEGLFEVSDIEVARGGPSYTIDTVRELRARGMEHVAWLIGADMVSILPKWHKPDELVREAELLVVARPGSSVDWEDLAEPLRRVREGIVDAPRIDVSATMIRRRVSLGQSVRYLTPDPVCEYIAGHGLYR